MRSVSKKRVVSALYSYAHILAVSLAVIAAFAIFGFFLFRPGDQRMSEHLAAGARMVAAGDSNGAIREYYGALAFDGNSVEAHEALARLQFWRSNNKRTEEHLRAALAARPQDFELRKLAAMNYLDGAEIGPQFRDRALEQLDMALMLRPGDAQILSLRAAAEFLAGDIAAADASAREAASRDPGNEFAGFVLAANLIAAGDFDGALQKLRGVRQSPMDPFKRKLYLLIIDYRDLARNTDAEGAGRLLARLVELIPADDQTRRALAGWYQATTPPHLDEAEAVLRDIVARNPGNQPDAFALIKFLQRARGLQAALAELEALADGPSSAPVFSRALIVSDLLSGDTAAAIRRLEAQIAKVGDKNSAEDRAMLAWILERDQEGSPRAAKLVEEILAQDPTMTAALTQRADARLRHGEISDALYDLRMASSNQIGSSRILPRLARAYLSEGNDQLALDQFGLAAKAEDYAPAPALRYASAIIRYGSFGSARAALVTALDRHPQNQALVTALAENDRTFREGGDPLELAALFDRLAVSVVGREQIRDDMLSKPRELDEALALLEEVWPIYER